MDASAALASLVEQLRADSPIAVLEQSERAAQGDFSSGSWRAARRPALRALASFQQGLGFLLKYKSYAVKAASPLGYSVFLQRPGEGFSFQRHVTHKTEIFYILDVPARRVRVSVRLRRLAACLPARYVSGMARRRATIGYERFRFVPRPGDVIVIDRLSVVHSVVGCVLVEFATVSTDMVDRLYDQNEGRPIPAEFTRAEQRMSASAAWPETSRARDAGPSGWSRAEIPSHAIPAAARRRLETTSRFWPRRSIRAGGSRRRRSSPDRAIAVHVGAARAAAARQPPTCAAPRRRRLPLAPAISSSSRPRALRLRQRGRRSARRRRAPHRSRRRVRVSV